MSDEKDFPVDYRDKMVTFERPISTTNKLGAQWVDRVKCVEVQESDTHYTLFQPNLSNERDNDVVEVKKDNVRAIVYMHNDD